MPPMTIGFFSSTCGAKALWPNVKYKKENAAAAMMSPAKLYQSHDREGAGDGRGISTGGGAGGGESGVIGAACGAGDGVGEGGVVPSGFSLGGITGSIRN